MERNLVVLLMNSLAARVLGSPELARRLNATYQFDLGPAGNWRLSCGVNAKLTEGSGAADCTIRIGAEDLEGVLLKKLNPQSLLGEGRLVVDGDAVAALRLVYLW